MLDKTFLEEIKICLEKEAFSLQSQLESFAKKDRQVPGDWDAKFPEFKGGNLEEKADEVEEYENLLQIEGALETKLVKVKKALTRIQKENYGQCEKCGQEITKTRLEMIPETEVCQNCKEK